MMQLLTVHSLTVEEKSPADKTEFHVVVHRGDGQLFRLRSERGRPFWLMNFVGQSVDSVRTLFAVGSIISADLKFIHSRWQTDADGFQKGDMSADPKTIRPTLSHRPELAAIRALPITATVPGEILFNEGAQMGSRPVRAALYRGSG